MNINAIIRCLDNYMIQEGLTQIDAPKANAVLERNGLLRDSEQRPGKPLRELLRAGKLPHAYQKGRTWIIPISGNIAAPVKMNIQRNTGSTAYQQTLTENNHDGPIMKFKSIEDLKKAGFKGFMPVWMLKSAGIFSDEAMADMELDRAGVYMVVRTDVSDPVFVPEGSGGHFKGKDPNVSIAELQANWVKGTCVVYIGKAGGNSSRATLRKRIGQYIRFGSGEPVGHWGGRYIWQLEDADNLLFCWRAARELEDAEETESKLIENFKSRYDGHRPFANLKD